MRRSFSDSVCSWRVWWEFYWLCEICLSGSANVSGILELEVGRYTLHLWLAQASQALCLHGRFWGGDEGQGYFIVSLQVGFLSAFNSSHWLYPWDSFSFNPSIPGSQGVAGWTVCISQGSHQWYSPVLVLISQSQCSCVYLAKFKKKEEWIMMPLFASTFSLVVKEKQIKRQDQVTSYQKETMLEMHTNRWF